MNWIKTSLVLVIIGITYLSLKPPMGGVEIKLNDKIGHTIAYFVLTVNLGLLLAKNKAWQAAIVAFLYSALMEFLQGYVPGRSVDWKDLVANGSGAAIGLIVLILARKYILQVLRKMKLSDIQE
jgi:VanZ family protein